MLLQQGDRRGGAAACREHGINHENLSFAAVFGKLAVVFHRLKGVRVAVEPDMAYFCGRDHIKRGRNQARYTIHHAQAGPKDRDHSQLAAGQLLYDSFGDRSFDLHVCQLQVAGRFVTHQSGDLRDNGAKILCPDVLSPDHANLMLDQRVVKNHYFRHVGLL